MRRYFANRFRSIIEIPAALRGFLRGIGSRPGKGNPLVTSLNDLSRLYWDECEHQEKHTINFQGFKTMNLFHHLENTKKSNGFKWRFPYSHGATPKWMAYFHGKIHYYKWMRTGGSPISGNHQMVMGCYLGFVFRSPLK